MNRDKNRYKASSETMVPKFGGESPAIPTCEIKQAELTAIAQGASPLKNTAAYEETLVDAAAQPPLPMAGKRNFLDFSWFNFRNLFSRKNRTAKRMVQAELRLGKVEPVRNDLNDSDLMVVSRPKDEIVKKRLWLAQSLLDHNRKDFHRSEESSRESQRNLGEQPLLGRKIEPFPPQPTHRK
ncbi:MAG: hypothetical protein ACO1QB_08550 [Verrucomicrobiales bacterium]